MKNIVFKLLKMILITIICWGYMFTSAYATGNLESSCDAEVSVWSLKNLSRNELDDYDTQFRIHPTRVENNGGNYGGSILSKAWDEDWNSHWETGKENTTKFQNQIEFTFREVVSISRIIYGARNDASNKGFANQFEIWGSEEENGEDFTLVATGKASTTKELVEIKFPEHRFKRLRFTWVQAKENWASARCFLFYKQDTLAKDIQELFTDTACSGLRADVTVSKISNLQEDLSAYPLKGTLQPYLDMAALLLSGSAGEIQKVRAPMTLSQRGNRVEERSRTGTGMTLASYDLSGYYAKPGESLEVYVNADPKGPMPRIVLAAVSLNTGWALGGYDGQVLSNGYNIIKVPDTMRGCQAIYFYNPALPSAQAFAPVVRLIGGTKYPVYRYNANDSNEEIRKKEANFIEELRAYVEGVTDDVSAAEEGNGNYNICEYVSDKILISVSARGALTGLSQEGMWNRGDWRDWIDKSRFGEVQYDGASQPIGIRYIGPAAVMECYEMLFDDIQIYSGFNTTNPAHPDYRNYGQFLFRAYNDGAGLGWGQNVFSGYNTGSRPNGNQWNDSFYVSLATVNTVLSAGWAIFHEIGHVFDSGIIGSSESTNNLYGLMAQLKYTGTNRLAEAGENRWYQHFTTYINTGVLPDNDLLFYPGAVIYQLDAVDFSNTTLYQNHASGDYLMSNYGRACRYARVHRTQINQMNYTDKLVFSLSMSCGVDLSKHFEYYGRTVSHETKVLLAGLPKEERPTWLVNDRTFKGKSFSEEDLVKAPTVQETRINDSTGAVTIRLTTDTYEEQNLQCYSIYRQEMDNSGNVVGDEAWIGVTGDNKSTRNNNELYQFTDVNVVPGKSYRYSVGAYDCTLNEAPNRSSVDISIGDQVNIPLTNLRINDGNEGKTMSVGNTYKLQAVFFPQNATIDLNSIRWWVEGYGRDNNKTGAGPDCITLAPDPDYPGDPTRRIATGIQSGQTHIKVSIGGMTQTHRMVINGNINLNKNKFNFHFSRDSLNLKINDVHKLSLLRLDKETKEIINVVKFPSSVRWESSDETVVQVTNNGTITAINSGDVIIRVYNGNIELSSCTIKVKVSSEPLTGIHISGEQQLSVGTSTKLAYALEPNNATELGIPTWSSSDSSIVRVDKNGMATAIKSGSAEITAKIGDISGRINVVVPEYIPLKNLTMMPSTSERLTDERKTVKLSLVKNPQNATAQDIIWKSSVPGVATVDSEGLVSAVAEGTSIITGYLDGKSISCTITVAVTVPLENVKFRGLAAGVNTSVSLKVEEAHQLMLYPEPLRASNLSSTRWTTDNPKVAIVKEGYITAVGEGSAIVTGTVTQHAGTINGIEKSVQCVVHVGSNTQPLRGLGISHSSAGLSIGEQLTLSVINQPTNANRASDGISEIGKTTWKSDHPNIASVSEEGVVMAVSEGETKITGSRGGQKILCNIVVRATDVAADAITLKHESLSIEITNKKGVKLTADILPQNATVAPYWVSSNPMVAQVDQSGRIIPMGIGETLVTAFVSGKSAQCVVNIIEQDQIPPNAPANIWVDNLTEDSVNVHWSPATDNLGIVGYKVTLGELEPIDISGEVCQVKFSDLTPSTSYMISIIARDMAGNVSQPATMTITTSSKEPDKDEEAPTIPSNVNVEDITETSALITWDISKDNIAVAGYRIFHDNQEVEAIFTKIDHDKYSARLSGLLPGTEYNIAVIAFDASENQSEQGNITFTTLHKEIEEEDKIPDEDQEAPTQPSNVQVEHITETETLIIWDISKDNVEVAGYRIYDGEIELIALFDKYGINQYSARLIGLIPETEYNISVMAFDTSGNQSEPSHITFTTLHTVKNENIIIPDTDDETGQTNIQIGENTIVESVEEKTDVNNEVQTDLTETQTIEENKMNHSNINNSNYNLDTFNDTTDVNNNEIQPKKIKLDWNSFIWVLSFLLLIFFAILCVKKILIKK